MQLCRWRQPLIQIIIIVSLEPPSHKDQSKSGSSDSCPSLEGALNSGLCLQDGGDAEASGAISGLSCVPPRLARRAAVCREINRTRGIQVLHLPHSSSSVPRCFFPECDIFGLHILVNLATCLPCSCLLRHQKYTLHPKPHPPSLS